MKYSKELHDTLVKSNYYDSHIINALLDEIDRLNAERRWIPVDDDTPKNKRVLILMENNYTVIATQFMSIAKDVDYYWKNDSGAICSNVIGWLPIPAPESEG